MVRLPRLGAVVAVTFSVLTFGASEESALADATGPMRMGEYVMGAPSAADDWNTRPAPMLMPVRTMMPGTWWRPGTWTLMGNAALLATNPGFSDAYDANLGRTTPYLVADWLMLRGRTGGSGILEGSLMLDFEAITLTNRGWYEVGQAGEGLWDRQHPHQLVHEATLAVHLTGAATEGPRATLWGGQGSAPIGPPIFMHRGSNPSPTVPRKHHKGENPHETAPVLGGTFELRDTALDAAVFSGDERGPGDSRVSLRVGAPTSYAARIRHSLGGSFEAQLSAMRLVGTHDTTQVSASVYGRYVGAVVVDALLDGAADVAQGPHVHADAAADSGPEPGPGGRVDHAGGSHAPTSGSLQSTPGSTRTAGVLFELAVRSASLRDIAWTRVELNGRVEPDGRRSTPWWFTTLGYERVAWVDADSILGLGIFGEATYVVVPTSVAPYYGDRTGVTLTFGLRAHLMYMPEHVHHRARSSGSQ